MTHDDPRRLPPRYPARLGPTGAIQPLGGGGGLSGSRLWRFASSAGEMVIRAWPERGGGRARVEAIHGWLRAAADLEFLPQPVAALDGRTVQEFGGRCWELAPWLPGSAEMSRPPAVERVRAAFEALAMVHRRLAGNSTLGPSPGLNARRDEVTRLVHGGFDAIERAVAARADDPLARPALHWAGLARRIAPAVLAKVEDVRRWSIPLQPCIRDARPEHFLFQGNVVSGLVDFGAMDVECVAGDLARLLGEWFPRPECDPLREEGLAAYRRERPLSTAEEALIDPFESLASLLIAERWVRWRFLEDRRFDAPQAHAQGIARGLERLQRLAERLG